MPQRFRDEFLISAIQIYGYFSRVGHDLGQQWAIRALSTLDLVLRTQLVHGQVTIIFVVSVCRTGDSI